MIMKKLFLLLTFMSLAFWGVGQEQLLNGAFENWDNSTTPSDWNKVENIQQESTEIHGGSYSAKHTGGTKDLGQTIENIIPGEDYTLTIWYKVVENDGTDARIWSYWKDGSTTLNDHANELRGPNNSYFDNNSGQWTSYSVTLTAPASADNFYFEVRTYSGAVVYWDDFSFVLESGTTEPTNHVTNFTATANSSSQITTSWTDAEAGDQAPSGYLVMANKTGNFANPVDGTAQADDLNWGDNAAVKNVAHGSGASYVWTSLDAATQYFFKIFPYNGSGDLINYKTDGDVPTDDATTQSNFDNDTEVYAPVSQIAQKTISSTDDTQGEAEDVFTITIEDQGSGDGEPTKVTKIRVKPHTTNTADWTDAIQNVFVDDGSDFIYPSATDIQDTYIDMTFGSTQLNVADGGSMDVTLYVYLNTTVIDGQILSFMVDGDDHGFTADASGSGFASEFLLGDFNSNDITIDVTFDEIRFTQQPSNTNLGEVMSPAVTVALTDENGNVDTDADGTDYTVGLTTTGSFDATATTSVDAASGVATFNNLVFDAEGSGIKLTTTDLDGWEWSNITSDGFDVTNTSSTGNVIISEMCDPQSNYNDDRYIEITNIDDVTIDLSGWTLDAITNDGSSVAFTWTLSGTIAPNESLTLGDTDNSVFTPDFAKAEWSSSNGSWNGNEGDGAKLYDGSKGLVDDAATPDGGSNFFENDAMIRLLSVTQPASTFNADEWFATGVDSPAESTPGYHINVWNGNANDSWTNSGNWSQGIATKELSHAIISSSASNMPTIAAKATGDVHDILLEEGATLRGQENLTVNGTATIEKTITGYTSSTNGWNLISSPVSGMTITGSDFEPVSEQDDLYEYDEENNEWLNYTEGTFGDDQFVAGKGYLTAFAPANAGTKQYIGALNANATYSPTISEANTKWNLIGNPYCSKLDWSGVTLNNVSSAKVLSNTTGEYSDVSGDLNVGQGVFVYAEEGSSSVVIPIGAQTHGSGGKKDAVNYAFMNLNFGEHTIHTRFAVNENASQNYEWQHDSRYLHPISQIPYFSAVTEDEIKVSTYVCETEAEEDFIVPLYFSVPADQEISFDFDGNLGYEIVLEDQNNNEMTELTDGVNYTFTASTSDAADRFLLHFKATTAVEDMESLDASIYTYDNKIYISGLAEVNNATVELFTVDGRRILAEQFSGSPVVQVGQKLPLGCYVVRLTSENQTMSKKIVLN